MKRPQGRPSSYTPELATLILGRLETGEALAEICRDDGMPPESTVRNWVTYHADFAASYARARDIGLDCEADQLRTIADAPFTGEAGELERRRQQIDVRKWRLGKMAPKRYGDRVALTGDADNPIRTLTKIEVVLVDAANGGSAEHTSIPALSPPRDAGEPE